MVTPEKSVCEDGFFLFKIWICENIVVILCRAKQIGDWDLLIGLA